MPLPMIFDKEDGVILELLLERTLTLDELCEGLQARLDIDGWFALSNNIMFLLELDMIDYDLQSITSLAAAEAMQFMLTERGRTFIRGVLEGDEAHDCVWLWQLGIRADADLRTCR